MTTDSMLASSVLQDRVAKILDGARQQLAIAVTIPQHKLIADIATAQEVFATRQRLGEDVISHAHTLKVEALAGLGELLKQTPKAKGGQPYQQGQKPTGSALLPVATLAEMGIDRKTSSLAQRLASLSDVERNAVASRDKTLAEVTRAKTAASRAVRLALPDAKFRVVYADPLWSYRDTADAGAVQSGGAAMQYPTMSIEALCDLKVRDICDEDAVLFLWVTVPLLLSVSRSSQRGDSRIARTLYGTRSSTTTGTTPACATSACWYACVGQACPTSRRSTTRCRSSSARDTARSPSASAS